MSSVRLIACDLDGTLLDADHCTVPEGNIRALREASARGASIVIPPLCRCRQGGGPVFI